MTPPIYTLIQLADYINKHKNMLSDVCIDHLDDMLNYFDHPDTDSYTSAIIGDAVVLRNRVEIYQIHEEEEELSEAIITTAELH
jgi:hypothetical protein